MVSLPGVFCDEHLAAFLTLSQRFLIRDKEG
jgi:hypothetical protein